MNGTSNVLNTCGCCEGVEQLTPATIINRPGLNALAAEFAVNGVRFYGVDMLDHDRALARAFVAEFKVPYASLADESGSAAARYEVDAPPSIVLVNGKGIVVGRFPGEASEAQLRALITGKLLTSFSVANG